MKPSDLCALKFPNCERPWGIPKPKIRVSLNQPIPEAVPVDEFDGIDLMDDNFASS